VFGKPARDCTPAQVARDAWEQLKAHLNDSGEQVLRDDMLHSWHLDPAMRLNGHGGLHNDTPLFIQNPGSWAHRPDAATGIPNLFLAGEWIKTNINVTTMDGANQGGRKAANALLDTAGSRARHAQLWDLYVPPEYELFRRIDQDRYRRGEPNMFDPDQARPQTSHPTSSSTARL
jgi:hypothetical protein